MEEKGKRNGSHRTTDQESEKLIKKGEETTKTAADKITDGEEEDSKDKNGVVPMLCFIFWTPLYTPFSSQKSSHVFPTTFMLRVSFSPVLGCVVGRG